MAVLLGCQGLNQAGSASVIGRHGVAFRVALDLLSPHSFRKVIQSRLVPSSTTSSWLWRRVATPAFDESIATAANMRMPREVAKRISLREQPKCPSVWRGGLEEGAMSLEIGKACAVDSYVPRLGMV